MNSERVIADFEASGAALEGTAARVLDYSAVWVKSDGSSRMLEHEIIRVQSAEAITEMAEQPIRGGMFLKLRVVKKDGRMLEPEVVGGKPTVTMPHLEIGDYIETERIEIEPERRATRRALHRTRAGSSAKRTSPTRAASSS